VIIRTDLEVEALKAEKLTKVEMVICNESKKNKDKEKK